MDLLRRHWRLLLLVPLLVLGCAEGQSNPEGQCIADDDCPMGRRCVQGICIPDQNQFDCGAGGQAECEPSCRDDEECPEGRCVDGECFENQCEEDETEVCPGPCGLPRNCLNGVWRPCPPEADQSCPDGFSPEPDGGLDAQTTDMDPSDGGEVDAGPSEDLGPMEADAEPPMPMAPRNDLCDNAVEIIAEGNQNTEGNSSHAETEIGPGPDVWYRFRVVESVRLDVSLSSMDGWDTHLALYSGNCRRLEAVASNDNFEGENGSRLVDQVLRIGTYFIQVSGANPDAYGPFELSINFEVIIPPPPNDLCERAVALPAGLDVELRGDTTGAMREYGPDFRGPDIWYRTQLEGVVDLAITLEGDGDWDTYLYLLKGSCEDLELVASNDDEPNIGRSFIAAQALDAGPYYIVVSGFNDRAFGPFDLGLEYSATLRVNEAISMATHNSYSGEDRRSVIAQLNHGVRSIELDIHDDSYAQVGDYRVGHDGPGDEVMRGDGNPDSLSLRVWLESIDAWSRSNDEHAPLFLVLDIKDDVTDNRSHGAGNLAALNHHLESIFGDRLFRASHMGPRGSEWPALNTLRGRIIVVLSGHEGSRRAYESDEGHDPAVAMNTRGDVVEVHDDGRDWVWYWTGQYQPDGHISWTSHARYARGRRPAVDLDDNGTVVTVFEDDGFDGLVAMVGSLRADGTGIDFGDEHPFDRGIRPSLRFNGPGSVHEIHQSQNNDQRWFWDGRVDGANRRIEWNDDTHDRTEQAFYDRASDTSRIDNRLRRVEVRSRNGDDHLRYSTDQVEDDGVRYEATAFVEAQPGDEDWIHQRIHFFAAEAGDNGSLNFVRLWGGRGGITRLWGYNEAQGQSPNHPATDEPFARWYTDHLEALGAVE